MSTILTDMRKGGRMTVRDEIFSVYLGFVSLSNLNQSFPPFPIIPQTGGYNMFHFKCP